MGAALGGGLHRWGGNVGYLESERVPVSNDCTGTE
jgi:hypothetical protein